MASAPATHAGHRATLVGGGHSGAVQLCSWRCATLNAERAAQHSTSALPWTCTPHHHTCAGPCGDPFQDDPANNPTRFLNAPATVQATYTAGQVVRLQWYISVNHGGRIGFKLCPRNTNLDQACFDQYALRR